MDVIKKQLYVLWFPALMIGIGFVAVIEGAYAYMERREKAQ